MLIKVERVDWRKIMRELSSVGYSIRRLAMIIDVPPSTIQNLSRGHEPRHWLGSVVLTLHEKHYGLSHPNTSTAATT